MPACSTSLKRQLDGLDIGCHQKTCRRCRKYRRKAISFQPFLSLEISSYSVARNEEASNLSPKAALHTKQVVSMKNEQLPGSRRSSFQIASCRSTGAMRVLWWLAPLFLGSLAGAMCPPRCECDDAALVVSCEDAQLEVLPIQLNPEVETVRLRGNRIASLEFSMAFYTRLRSLDVSANVLQNLGPGLFQDQRRLMELNVSNNAITMISPEAFSGLTDLRALDLSSNQITSASEGGVWKGLESLWELDLSHNRLDALSAEDDDSDCAPLRNLRTLILDGNIFSFPPSNCLAHLDSLRQLGLADNRLTFIGEEAFPATMGELQTLNLQGNQIASLTPNCFSNLTKLQVLDLSDNNITFVPTTSLARLGALQDLDLSGNPISRIAPLAFQALFELRRLRVSRLSELEHIDPRALVENVRLEEVRLELCPRLKRLPPRLFHSNPLLTRVALRGNALQTISAGDLPLRQLRFLALADNPLRCNCSLLWLWKLARSSAQKLASRNPPSYGNHTPTWAETAGGATCWEPVPLRGTPVYKAPEETVGCEASWATVLMVTGVVLSLFTLTCAILFYCGGGGRWCRAETTDTPSSRINGIKEHYPQPPSSNMYHQHHLLHHHHMGLGPPHMWTDPDQVVPPEYEYATTDGGLISVKKPSTSNSLGVYV
ncbi:leucine-rich repeat and immunoglobulin-like domain containing-NOGO receptor-interacting protein 4 isoform X3 [Neocloeon triangulifer]|uniref:leucine-rich repeat and immunoglobulin-like domain containing-NOGO receptor-interacting protein 4 isoform X3 n=1 Tax=Neocloeon triangulifer TaxID=2078957 RepID=UPI00286EBE50|nr:leucine-rich repeat and immunoglobulin-like domain containing-NOGO receptor-interacting protein 4 isoform X3 [Neocloeon triangulifer]